MLNENKFPFSILIKFELLTTSRLRSSIWLSDKFSILKETSTVSPGLKFPSLLPEASLILIDSSSNTTSGKSSLISNSVSTGIQL